MNTFSRPSLIPASLTLVLALAGSALASPREQLASLYRDTRDSATPNMAFFGGLLKMADFNLGQDDMRWVRKEAELPTEGLLGAFLTGINGMSKKGDRITLKRAEGIVVSMDSGCVKLDKEITFRLRRTKPTEIKIDKIDGVRVGKSEGTTFPLRYVNFERKGTETWAHINAGYALINMTESVKVVDTAQGQGLAQAVNN